MENLVNTCQPPHGAMGEWTKRYCPSPRLFEEYLLRACNVAGTVQVLGFNQEFPGGVRSPLEGAKFIFLIYKAHTHTHTHIECYLSY